MARNKFDVDENLESPFSFAHLKRAMKYVKKHAFKMVLALVLSCIASVVALFGPKIMQWALDDAVPHNDFGLLGRLALFYTLIVIIGIVFTTIRARIMAHVSQEIVYDIREDLFAHLQRLPFSYYDSRPAGKILVRVINYVNSVSDMLSNGIINSILEIVNVAFIIVFMYSTNVLLATIVVAGLPLFAAVIWYIKPRQRKYWQAQSNKNSNYNAYLAESIDGVRVSQLFAREEEVRADIRQCWAEAYQRFRTGCLPKVANRNIEEEAETAREAAQAEDVRRGLIADYLENRREVCILELWREALQEPGKPAPRQSLEIADLLQGLEGWERGSGNRRFSGYGVQKYWVKRTRDLLPEVIE